MGTQGVSQCFGCAVVGEGKVSSNYCSVQSFFCFVNTS